MTQNRLKGVLAPAVTAFSANFQIEPKRSIAHCHWLLKHGCDALVVFGTTSEANSLSSSERRDLLEQFVASGLNPRQLLVGTGSCSLVEAVELTKHALSLGCSDVLMLPPFYYKAVSDEGLARFFRTVIDRVADSRLRIYLYHIPPVAKVGFSLALVEELMSRFPDTIAGVKDSSGDWHTTEALIKNFYHLNVFTGSESYILPALRLGGAGCISGTANVAANAIQHLYRNFAAPEAEALQSGLNRIREAFQRVPLIAAVKAILAEANNDDGWRGVRPPLQPLSVPDSQALAAELRRLEFVFPRAGQT
jgi:4-hydroxy-tetrahydrodipicolinate synthase